MSLLGELASKGISTALTMAFKSSPITCTTATAAMKMVGAALIDLSDKLADGKITEEEINDSLAKVGAMGNDSVALAAKSAIGRLLEHIL
jgi:hypothetical protein